ncbi:unnamed protein product, partial [Ectocarpus sp. 4 AP-2014]
DDVVQVDCLSFLSDEMNADSCSVFVGLIEPALRSIGLPSWQGLHAVRTPMGCLRATPMAPLRLQCACVEQSWTEFGSILNPLQRGYLALSLPAPTPSTTHPITACQTRVAG